MTRRDLLQSAGMLAGAPCACLAAASRDCCTLPEPIAAAVRIEPGTVVLDLVRIPELRRAGGAVKVLDAARNPRILVVHPDRDRFVALDQKCTHGGGPLTYVPRQRHIYCTCWGHSKFALDGSVLRWPNAQPPKPLRAHAVERHGDALHIRVEGLV